MTTYAWDCRACHHTPSGRCWSHRGGVIELHPIRVYSEKLYPKDAKSLDEILWPTKAVTLEELEKMYPRR
jgi:hypothetical protein